MWICFNIAGNDYCGGLTDPDLFSHIQGLLCFSSFISGPEFFAKIRSETDFLAYGFQDIDVTNIYFLNHLGIKESFFHCLAFAHFFGYKICLSWLWRTVIPPVNWNDLPFDLFWEVSFDDRD
ncbi:hypothetical protein BMS3Abin09_01315 [bacterium BMS3Abin09]|nr:hypothetical protein BMS3Abin09_01315 [bacterium BMS3Abin09]